MHFLKFFCILNVAFSFKKTAITKVGKYLDFVHPFLKLFITPKRNGKLMEVKIAALERKFKRYSGRFIKYYKVCGIDESGEKRGRREDEGEEEIDAEEKVFLEEIQNEFNSIMSQRSVRGKIGDLTAYDVTVQNMSLLWHKITAGFGRNFDRHIRPGSCSPRVVARLDRRLQTAKTQVAKFIRTHRGW